MSIFTYPDNFPCLFFVVRKNLSIFKIWNTFKGQWNCSPQHSCCLPHPKSLGLFYYCYYFFWNLRVITDFSSESQVFRSLILVTHLILLLNLVKGDHNFSFCVKVLAILVLLLASEHHWRANTDSAESQPRSPPPDFWSRSEVSVRELESKVCATARESAK